MMLARAPDRIEELEAEVAYLRSELGLQLEAADVHQVRTALGLSLTQCRLLIALCNAKGRPMSATLLDEILPSLQGKDLRSSKFVAQIVHQVRARLGQGLIRADGAGNYFATAAGIQLVEKTRAAR
ncbi:MAG: hypothetical protein ACXU82_03725 [Caulobacteraceae bacterium]